MFLNVLFNRWIIVFLLLYGSCLVATNDKWIVITSINYPTKAVEKLASLEDWNVVIVADKKTPLDWHFPSVTCLTVEMQKQLPYRIAKLLPWNHYCRKNIGYLYAIEHGACIIYDTDDDNILCTDILSHLPERCLLPSVATKGPVFNPYAYFGQPTVWPRGYPLEYIHTANFSVTEPLPSRSLIQSGVVDNDPDIDAIFRLTRELPIFFDKKPAISLPSGIMAPFNTQNTIFHYDAFWGLLIPMTTPFRVCDIWRGYWAQRLLWDIGGNVCFAPPEVRQDRNEHNLIRDFEDEIELYCKSGSLITLLRSWKSVSVNLSDRLCEITQLMIDHGFYGNKEIELVEAWIADLKDVGYVIPNINTEDLI